jgi:NADH-quinone oxidoreductase subunit F
MHEVANLRESRTSCALDDATAWPIRRLFRHFRPEMERRIAEAKGGEMLKAAE